MHPVAKYALIGAGTVAAIEVAKRLSKRCSFAGKTVLITGGSRGLGFALAQVLAAEGARLALIARDGSELDAAVGRLGSAGAEAAGYVCDVTDEVAVAAAVDEVERDFGTVDALMNVAGVMFVAPFENMPSEDFRKAMDTNMMGALYTTRAVLPIMRRNGGGRILNVSSIGGKVGVPHMSAYSASKYALVGFSHAVAAELRSQSIYVTVACPGLMRTGSHNAALFRGQYAKESGWFTAAAGAPYFSTAADKAARQLVDACREGRVEVTFPMKWRLAALGAGVFAGLAVRTNALVNRFLPQPTPETVPALPGSTARGDWPPSWYTRRMEGAGRDLNQSSA